jgi:serine/threonine protein phosphatase PrpC
VFTAGNDVVIVVADGVSGRPYGAEAASRVTEIVRVASNPLSASPAYWSTVLLKADRELCSDRAVGEAAVAIVSINAGRAIGASVGDCEAWIVFPGKQLRLSRTRKPYLGSGVATPYSFEALLDINSTLILASDGLFKYADEEAIARAALLPSVNEAATALVELPKTPDGSYNDDVAVVVCRHLKA